MTAQASGGTAPFEYEGSIELPRGRRLAYAELGAPDGQPVVVLDGPGSRGLARAAAGIAGRSGLRLIAPDRPGFGGSTPVADRTIASWPEDLSRLLDALGLSMVGVVGQSGGTPYALATAASPRAEVRAVSLCGPVSPLGEPDALEGVEGQARAGFRLARSAPWALRLTMRLAARQARKDPEKAAERVLGDLPPADAEVMTDPANRAIHVRTTAEIMSHPEAMAREMRMLARPWGIDLGEVRVPVAMWVGERDTTHPPPMARRLEERLPDARVHLVSDAGTFGLRRCYEEALRFCTA